MSRLRNDLAARQPYLQQDFSDAEYDRRLALVRAGMARESLDALIVYCGVGSYANVRWLTLDITRIVTRGTWVEKPDLTRVDEVGFADLTPGSGHGWGGFVNVARLEGFGVGVAR